MRVTIRAADPSGEGYTDVLVAHFKEVGIDADLDAAMSEVERWIVEQGLETDTEYKVEGRRERSGVGAELTTAVLVITFLMGVASNATWDALLHFVKGRLVPGKTATPEAAWFRQLHSVDASFFLHAELAGALDRPRSDFQPREIVRNEEKVEGTFETVAGEVYVIRVSPNGFRVTKVPDK